MARRDTWGEYCNKGQALQVAIFAAQDAAITQACATLQKGFGVGAADCRRLKPPHG
jgi:hypothetical protein